MRLAIYSAKKVYLPNASHINQRSDPDKPYNKDGAYVAQFTFRNRP